MAGVKGLEPSTFCVTGRRSNQLSYTPKECEHIFIRFFFKLQAFFLFFLFFYISYYIKIKKQKYYSRSPFIARQPFTDS